MKTSTDNYLTFAKIFLGMFITAICISFLVVLTAIVWGYFDPQTLSKFTWKPDLLAIRDFGDRQYLTITALSIIPLIFYFLLFFNLIKISSKLNLEKPFNEDIAKSMQNISFYLIGIFFIGYIAETYINVVMAEIAFAKTNIYHEKFNFNLDKFYPLVAGATTYIFSLIYKKGLELQSENDLTV